MTSLHLQEALEHMRGYDFRSQDEITVLPRTMKPNAGGGDKIGVLSLGAASSSSFPAGRCKGGALERTLGIYSSLQELGSCRKPQQAEVCPLLRRATCC